MEEQLGKPSSCLSSSEKATPLFKVGIDKTSFPLRVVSKWPSFVFFMLFKQISFFLEIVNQVK